MEVQCVPHLLPCTHEDDIGILVKHYAIKADQFFKIRARIQFIKLFRVIGTGGKCSSSFARSHKIESRGEVGQIWRSRRPKSGPPPPPGRSIAQATADSRMLSPHCGCAIALRHVEKRHLVCLEADGALNTTVKCHGK
jgi:hypothetical protein